MTERDWVQVVAHETCDECGFDASAMARDVLAEAIREEATEWSTLLENVPPLILRGRPVPGWSPLEYAAHARDVLWHFHQRVQRALVEDRPAFGWWDHESVVVDEAYNEQEPPDIAAALVINAGNLANTLDEVSGDQWHRKGTRRSVEVFSVEGLARYALHETRHHRLDAEERCVPGIESDSTGT